MMNFKDTPIKRKLMTVILLICSVVLFLMCGAYMVLEVLTLRQTVKEKVSTLGHVIAANSSAALAFESKEDATEILNALKADKNIVAAALYDGHGHLFATYPLSLPANTLPARPDKEGYRFKDSYLVGYQPVMQKDALLGTLYIRASLHVIDEQVARFGLIGFVLVAIALLIAYLLSNVLQRTISAPVLELEQAARKISEQKDYSVRAVKRGRDELGALTDAFNHMLSQIEVQNQEIMAAQEESAKLAAIVESSGDAIIGVDLDGKITSWNNSARYMFNYSPSEMIGRDVEELFTSERKQDIGKVLRALRKDEVIEQFETEFQTKDKRIIDISITVSPVKNPAGEIIGLSQIARDITTRKQDQRRLMQSEEHLRLAISAAGLGTFDLDILSNRGYADRLCREMYGNYSDNPIIQDSNNFMARVHPEDKSQVSQEIERAFDRELSDGYYEVEHRTVVRDEKVRWVRVRGKVFFNEEDKPVRFIGAVIDITDKKLEELKKNDFIAIISHELKTPLTSIKSYLQLLLTKATKAQDPFIFQALSRAELQTNKMSSMIKDFLSLARIEEGKLKLDKEVFELDGVFEDLLTEASFLTSTHTIEVDKCPRLKVFADKDKIEQVLLNLLTNAAKYSRPNTCITLGCEEVDGKAKILVKDQGIGISRNDQKKLFDRFYRVQDSKMKTVSGFGIGLYIVSEILRLHNSKILVESREGEGSTFYFYLDLID